MIGSKSWNEDYFGAEPFEHGLPNPLYVEFHNGVMWDLWAECETVAEVKEEVDILRARGFEYRVTDDLGKERRVG